MHVLIVYDSRRRAGATRVVARCIARALERLGVEAIVCRARDSCPSPRGFDLVVVGTPIYCERPMRSVLKFIGENEGLKGLRVAVFITCLATHNRIPSLIRNIIARVYLGSVVKHVNGKLVASMVVGATPGAAYP